MASSTFRLWLSRYLWAMTAAFVLSAGVLVNFLYYTYWGEIESWLSPAYIDRTHTQWRQHDDGTWSAVVYINKIRGSCVYVSSQIETVLAILPDGRVIESLIAFVDDPSSGSNRSQGRQRLDNRVHLVDTRIVEGTIISGHTIYQCGDGGVTVARWGPTVVGEEEPFSYYVEAWIAAGQEGEPNDYR